MTTSVRLLLCALLLVAAACSSADDGDDTADSADTADTADTATADDADADAGGDVPTSPASVTAEDQEGDGTTVTVASITLPTAGFIAVHGDGDGGPGPVIGHSDLLPEGESTDVSVTLDEPLTEDATVYPMAHVDANGNGEYEFNPPEETIDGPAMTDAGDVAVVGLAYTVAGGAGGDDSASAGGGATITIEGFDFGEPITVAAGEEITITNEDEVPHTWTAEDGTFDSGTIAAGESFSASVDQPGEYAFMCTIHPQMMGSITVS